MVKDNRTIIGLIGQPLSGKDTVASYLQSEHNFTHISTGDLVRAYIKESNLGEPERPLVKDTANKLRAEHGNDYLVQVGLKHKGDLVISGLRHPDEVSAVKEAGGTIVVVSAPQQKRYEWTMSRKREGDTISFDEFKKQEEAEYDASSPSGQHVLKVLAMADVEITNEGTLDELKAKVHELLKKLLQ